MTKSDDDDYGDDAYEPDSPLRSPSPPPPPPAGTTAAAAPPSVASPPSLASFNDSEQGDVRDDEPSPQRTAKRMPRRGSAGRRALSNAPCAFTVEATRVRGLRLMGDAAVRIFAVLDRQSRQSRGAVWRGDAAAKWTSGDGALRWTLQMETFRRLKAYNPRLKVFVFGAGSDAAAAHDGETDEQTAIVELGWLFLDLRTPDLPLRWLKLQGARHGGEIQLRSSLAPVSISSPPLPPSTASDGVKATALRPAEAPAMPAHAIVTDDAGDYLQLGARSGVDVFVVSVTIEGANNLAPLVQTGQATGDGFWLSYSLFDVVVQTDVFRTLDAADFPPIRDSFRVRSCREDLRAFVDAARGELPVYLCTANKLIAGVAIPLADLLVPHGGHDNLFTAETLASGMTAKVSGSFSFPEYHAATIAASVVVEYIESRTSMEVAETAGGVNVARSVELAVENRAVEEVEAAFESQDDEATATEPIQVKLGRVRLANSVLMPLVGRDGVTVHLSLADEQESSDLAFCGFEQDYSIARASESLAVTSPASQRWRSEEVRVRVCASSSNLPLVTGVYRLSDATTGVVPLVDESGSLAGQCTLRLGPPTSSKDTISVEPSHMYQLSLQIKAVRDFTSAGEYAISFQHPFLDGVHARSTPVVVPAKREMAVRDAYCVGELDAAPPAIKQLMSDSIAIEMLPTRDGETGACGVAVFSLNYLFYSEERFCCPDGECRSTFSTEKATMEHWDTTHDQESSSQTNREDRPQPTSLRSCSIHVPVIRASSGRSDRIGTIRIVGALEDFGPTPMATSREERQLVPDVMANISRWNAALAIDDVSAQSPVDLDRTTRTEVAAEVREKTQPPSKPPTPPPDIPTIATDTELRVRLEQDKAVWQREQQLAQLEWKRQALAVEHHRMDELEEEWARREEERAELLRSAQREYEQLERQLRTALANVEKRERRLNLAEAALEREQRTQREDVDVLRKRLASEQAHTTTLASNQRQALEQRVAQLESQLAAAESRAREVERDYTEYRQQQRKVPETRLREEISSLKGEIADLERQKAAEERAKAEAVANADRLRAQVEQLSVLVREERKKQEIQAVDELEKLRLKYLAREEKFVLDGDRDELRAIKKQLDELRGLHARATATTRNTKSPSRTSRRSAQSPTQRRPKNHQRARRTIEQRASSIDGARWRNDVDGDDAEVSVAAFSHSTPSPSNGRRIRGSACASDWDEVLSTNGTGSPISKAGRRDLGSPNSHGSALEEELAFEDDGELSSEHSSSSSDRHVQDRSEYASPRQHTPAIAPVPTTAAEQELKRLQRERELLLASGTYNGQSYLVRELDRLIAGVRGKMRL